MRARTAIINDNQREISFSPWEYVSIEAISRKATVTEIKDDDYRSVHMPCKPFPETTAA